MEGDKVPSTKFTKFIVWNEEQFGHQTGNSLDKGKG